jgi:hypothetical protein
VAGAYTGVMSGDPTDDLKRGYVPNISVGDNNLANNGHGTTCENQAH